MCEEKEGSTQNLVDSNRQQHEDKSIKSELLSGKHSVTEALQAGVVDSVLIDENMPEREAAYYIALAKQAGAVAKRTRREKLDAMCMGARHGGVAAFVAQVTYADLSDLMQIAKEREEKPFLLLCDGIADPHNLGALIRTALLCGAHGVVIEKRGCAQVTATVMKASSGAASHLAVARVANLGECIRRLKKENVFVYCADLEGVPVHKTNLDGAVALVVGSEGSGVSPLVKKLCDGALRLSMVADTSGVDSYNVSVAGGILMYEVLRGREEE